jgi:hypothetical protein
MERWKHTRWQLAEQRQRRIGLVRRIALEACGIRRIEWTALGEVAPIELAGVKKWW